MYKKVSSDMNFVDREKETLEFWKQNNIFEKSIEATEGGPTFTFYDGPPTANGKPHIGHILTRVMKDIIPRYKTMKGYHVLRKAGWDTHGLPVELEVEKQLGIDGKSQIENYGIEPFINECKKSVWKYKSEWERMSDRVGYWADMENPYVTYNDSYIESVWWSLKKIHEKGLLYKGHKVVPYCPRCGTSLSSHEVAQGYKDVTETSVFVLFSVKGRENTYLLAWTTTPWTLPSNVALCMNPNEEYSEIEYEGKTLIMANALIPSLLKNEYKVLNTKTGKDYEGTEYEPLFDFVTPNKKAYYVVTDTYVTLDAGSGIVHIAPAFGEDDARVGRNYDLPFVQLVDAQGKFVEEATPYVGKFAKDADPQIIEDLEKSGKLFEKLDYTHSYPFCWRCDTPLLYYARSTWFVRMTALRENLLKNNAKINWLPGSIRDGRMGNFLENVIDWGLSRERYWGTPLPVWECECGHFHVIGSKDELRAMSGLEGDIELHKPYIDQVEVACPECGQKMKRVSEVIDCWYDSGSMPFAQWHYPFENKEIFEDNFPADFISEAIDQTRGWFYTLSAISTLLFDTPAFKNCIVLGHVNDKDGQKMSKHKGNVVDPWTVLDKQGADAVRWYFYTSSAPWLPSRFYEEAVSEAQRKFMGTLWNTYAFFVLYANIDKFNPTEYKLEKDKLSVMDKWILSRLNSLIGFVDENLNEYRITEPAREIQNFADDLSNWYVRRCRGRFWGSEMTQDKINAYMTLHTVLVTLAKLSAPFVPFVAEQIYGNLVCTVDKNAPVSVHLTKFPVADAELIDKALEENMDYLLKVVVTGRACRNAANIKNRQPLNTMYVSDSRTLPQELLELIEDELNVKNVVFTEDTSDFTTYTFKPQLRTLGPKYGKLVPKIGQALLEVDGNEVMKGFDNGKQLEMVVEGTDVTLAKEDLLITPANKDGFFASAEGGLTVVLDGRLDDTLIAEGLTRELVSKIQTMRKEIGLEVTDHIMLTINGTDRLHEVACQFASEIKADVLAEGLKIGENAGQQKEWDINGHKCVIGIEKA